MTGDPIARRPHMPGYGVLGPQAGDGLLPWSWARERLLASRNYWLSTVWPDGRPHAMPIWGIWTEEGLWLSTSVGSRKVRNLLADPRCVVTTEDAENPVVVEGVARIATLPWEITLFVARLNEKYAAGLEVDFQDPSINATVCVRPVWAFAMAEGRLTDSPTRWQF